MVQTKSKAATTVVSDWNWRNLSTRDVALAACCVLLLFNLIWLAWSQAEQSRQLATLRQQVDAQTGLLNNVNQQFTTFVQNQAAADARKAASAASTPVPVAIPAPAPSPNASGAGTTGGTAMPGNPTGTVPTPGSTNTH
jgi:transcription initiation factor TFIID subunit TAF12